MDEAVAKFVAELDESIEWHYRMFRRLTGIQWAVMIFVALAGVLTTAAGLPGNDVLWFAQPNALLAWGAAAAVGAVINQLGNPTKSGENHLKIKLACKTIKGAVQFRNLPLDIAEQARAKARTLPDEAVEMVNQWKPGNGT